MCIDISSEQLCQQLSDEISISKRNHSYFLSSYIRKLYFRRAWGNSSRSLRIKEKNNQKWMRLKRNQCWSEALNETKAKERTGEWAIERAIAIKPAQTNRHIDYKPYHHNSQQCYRLFVITKFSIHSIHSVVELTCTGCTTNTHWIFDLQWFQFAQMIYRLFGGHSDERKVNVSISILVELIVLCVCVYIFLFLYFECVRLSAIRFVSFRFLSYRYIFSYSPACLRRWMNNNNKSTQTQVHTENKIWVPPAIRLDHKYIYLYIRV